MNIRLFLGGLRPPKPSQGPGPGYAGRRPASAEGWGNPVSPSPLPRAYVHVSPPCGSAAHRRDENKVVLGRATPSQTLPRAEAWGNPVAPFPCGAGAWGNPVSPHPCSSSLFSRSFTVTHISIMEEEQLVRRALRCARPARSGVALVSAFETEALRPPAGTHASRRELGRVANQSHGPGKGSLCPCLPLA